MRIDFGASYKEVSKLLRASSTPSREAGQPAFENSLRALIDPVSQRVEISSDTVSSDIPRPSNTSEREDIRAGYKFAEPELELPIVETVVPEQPPTVQEKPSTPPVKTPTLLEVRRVEVSGDVPAVSPSLVGRPEIKELLTQMGKKFGVDPALSMAVVKAESDFNPRAVSSDGHASKGLFQLLDSTGKDLLSRGQAADRSYDPFDPNLNVELGTSYLKYLHDIFSTPTALPNEHTTVPASDAGSLEKLAVAAFNAGEGRVASAQRRAAKAGKDPAIYEQVAPFLPASTREYVMKVVNGKSLY